MKEFNLEEYLKDPSQKVVTRDGRQVRIICTDYKGSQPIIGLVAAKGKKEIAYCFTIKGNQYSPIKRNCNVDLFFAPIKREGWINVFYNFPKEDHDYFCDKIYKTKEDAEKDAKKYYNVDNYVTTTKIEWEE